MQIVSEFIAQQKNGRWSRVLLLVIVMDHVTRELALA